jgi:hypothetical protein
MILGTAAAVPGLSRRRRSRSGRRRGRGRGRLSRRLLRRAPLVVGRRRKVHQLATQSRSGSCHCMSHYDRTRVYFHTRLGSIIVLFSLSVMTHNPAQRAGQLADSDQPS